jgi:Domain of unknown function (DUF6946)
MCSERPLVNADVRHTKSIMTITKDGRPILDLLDWSKRAGPKSSDQWREDRSAMEAARSWLAARPELPAEIAALLASHSAFGIVNQWEAEPEARLPFDDFPGEPRNTDLAVYGRDQFGDFALAVEAKADEPFGGSIADALAAAVDRKLENPRSNGVARVEQLAMALLGPRLKGEPALGQLRYQLLTATAGALRAGETRGATRVVLVVQEFWTRLTTDARHALNAADLNGFVSRLSHGNVSVVEPGVLYGPFAVPGAPLFNAPQSLFIGKARINLRNRGA